MSTAPALPQGTDQTLRSMWFQVLAASGNPSNNLTTDIGISGTLSSD